MDALCIRLEVTSTRYNAEGVRLKWVNTNTHKTVVAGYVEA